MLVECVYSDFWIILIILIFGKDLILIIDFDNFIKSKYFWIEIYKKLKLTFFNFSLFLYFSNF